MSVYKGQDVINGALRLIGVLAEGETPTASVSNDALNALNDLIDSWSNESLIVFPILREILSFGTAGLKQTYGLGVGGDLNGPRPIRVDKVLIQLNGSNPAIEFPVKMLNVDEYSDVVLKTLTSNFPLYCYLDDAYPVQNISVWPVPTDSTNNLVIYSQKPLANVTLTGALSVPPGYQRMMRYNLAVELAPEFGKAIPQAVADVARNSLAIVKRSNKKPVYLSQDSAIRALPGAYNWRTDGYNR